jgi:hypothetical protein
MEREIEEIAGELDLIANDTSIPRNIRSATKEIRDLLLKKDTPWDIKVASALTALGDLTNDPNIPMHGRTCIWNIISKLEKVA